MEKLMCCRAGSVGYRYSNLMIYKPNLLQKYYSCKSKNGCCAYKKAQQP